MGIGAGDSCDPYKTFPIREHHEQVLRDLIARDKNHPCIVMWSMGNEPDTEHFPESAYDYWHSLYEFTHRLDPQNRPVTFVCCQNNYEKDIVTRTMDVVCLNRYYGWYNLSGDLEAASYAWVILELDFWEKIGKPVMMTEYGADTLAVVEKPGRMWKTIHHVGKHSKTFVDQTSLSNRHGISPITPPYRLHACRRQSQGHLYQRSPSEADRPLFPGQMGAYSEFPLQEQE